MECDEAKNDIFHIGNDKENGEGSENIGGTKNICEKRGIVKKSVKKNFFSRAEYSGAES